MSIQVSVCLIAYNHENYVAQTLDSILSQQTSFDFEIIARDDASTDGTAAILRDFERRFPDKVRLILEPRNRFHDPETKPLIGRVFAPRARGRYLATCEGDDWWTCPNKLQRQFEFMESHPKTQMCCHAVEVVSGDGKPATQLLTCGPTERDIECEEVMENWARTTRDGIWSLHPSSCFSRREADLAYASEWNLQVTAGDFVRMCYFSHKTPVHFMPEVMSAYRYLPSQSWTARGEQDAAILAQHYREFIETMSVIDELTNYEHHDAAMRGCKQRALLLAGMTSGIRFFKSGVGLEVAPFLNASDYLTLAALRTLNALGRRPMRDTSTGRVKIVRV